MKYFTCLTLAFFISLSHGLRAQLYTPLFDKINTVKEARADIDFIKNTLEKGHPNLYRYISKKTFDKKMDSLKRSIKQPVTQIALRNAVLSVLTFIGNGHLSLILKSNQAELAAFKAATLKTYPIEQFTYQILQGRLFITSTSDPNALIPPGAEVLSIDGITVAKMLADFCSVISSDGYNQTFKFTMLSEGVIPDLFTQFYGLKERLAFKINVNDSARVVQVNTIPVHKPAPVQTGKQTPDFILLPNASAYLKVTGFPQIPFAGFASIPGQSQSGLLAQLQSPHLSVFQRLASSRTTSLILDLRNNTGGDYLTATNLFSYLIDRPSLFARVADSVLNNKVKTPNERLKYGSATPVTPQSLSFKGTLYVLINGGTFSCASLLAANLQGIGRAVFIGEESGGGRNYLTAGLITEAVAPNSHLILRFGNIVMETPILEKTEGRGVMPNHEVSYSIKEYLSGVDKELEWAKSQIAKQSKK
ncbi:S41 family peptidase [Mucilaginibacter sp. HD30]